MFRTLSRRAASTGSRLSIIAACDRLSGLAAAASRLPTQKKLTFVQINAHMYPNSHCRSTGRGIAALLPLPQNRLISRRDAGGPQSGRGCASQAQEALRLEAYSAGQARHGTVRQPCKRRSPHHGDQLTPRLVESVELNSCVFLRKKSSGKPGTDHVTIGLSALQVNQIMSMPILNSSMSQLHKFDATLTS